MAKLIMCREGLLWRGMRLMELALFPAEAEGETGLAEILSARAISCELLILKEKKVDPLTVVLILRWSGINRGELARRMAEESEIILKRIRSVGIDAQYIDNSPELKNKLWMLNWWISGQGTEEHSQATGYYPQEEVCRTGQKTLWVPGSWGRKAGYQLPTSDRCDGEGKTSLDWSKMMRVLNGYAPVMLSLQWIPTRLQPEETQCIKDTIQWFRPGDQENSRTQKTKYEKLLGQQKEPMCQLNLWITGNREACRDFSLLMQSWHMQPATLPAKALPGMGYLLRGDRQIANLMNRYGHLKEYRGNRLGLGLSRLSRLAPKEETAMFVGFPKQFKGISGLQITGESIILPEAMSTAEETVLIGKQDETERDVYFPISVLSRHGCITGKPGSGKTTFALGFLYRCWKAEIPFLAIEPAKREYRSLSHVIEGLQIWTPGDSSITPMPCNLFLPPPGVTLEIYKPCVDQIFDMTFSMTSLLKDVFTKVIRDCYIRHGWQENSTRDSEGVTAFGLHEFIREFRDYTRREVLNQESRDNVENSGVLRLQKLLEANPVMFDTNHAPDYESMLTRPTIIELDALTDATQKSLVLAMILVNLMALIRQRTDLSGKIRNMILLDEAHVILDPADKPRDTESADPGAAALKMLQNMTLILRGYGTALFFGDQSPSKLTREILGNVEAKMMFQLDDATDRNLLGETARMEGEMLEKLPTLKSGQGYFCCNLLQKPILLQTGNTKKELGLPEDVSDDQIRDRLQRTILPPFTQCGGHEACHRDCDLDARRDARFLARKVRMDSEELKELLPADPEQAKATKHLLPAYLQERFPAEVEQATRETGIPWSKRLAGCCQVQMIRELLIDGSCQLTEEELTGRKPVKPEQPGQGNTSFLGFRNR